MEVHAHSHTPGKKWTHYLWEFLMLFLAVFCGFLAENFREHQVEKERGKQYIRSLCEDLKTDTARMALLIDFENKKIGSLSNLSECYQAIIKDLNNTSCLFGLFKNSTSNNKFLKTDRTLKQLANAGGFRLLNKEDADSIIVYENLANRLQEYESSVYQQSQDNVRNTFTTLVDFTANASLYSDVTTDPNAYKSDINEPLLFSPDKALLNKYFNELLQYLRVTVGHRNNLKRLKEKAIQIILFFQQKHHLQ
jgi:hypothetical protein